MNKFLNDTPCESQIAIFSNDLAAFLILKGHVLDNQNIDYKRKKRWIYWFKKDDDIYKHMADYDIFRTSMRLIRQEAKTLDNNSNMVYNVNVDTERGL